MSAKAPKRGKGFNFSFHFLGHYNVNMEENPVYE